MYQRQDPTQAFPDHNAPMDNKEQAQIWFKELRDKICAEFEKLEDELAGSALEKKGSPSAGRFERKQWDRDGGGGGEMSIMHGREIGRAHV